MHVHVKGPDGEAKFWVEPNIELAQNYGLTARSPRSLRSLGAGYRQNRWTAGVDHSWRCKMNEPPTIECKQNGPYLVKDLTDLRSSNGAAIPTKPVIALCRCGGSSNKPFCDGTHQKNGFSGVKQGDAGATTLQDYRTLGITIHDNRGICAHAGHCTAGLASVFEYGSEPWIDPDGAKVEAIVQTIRNCPSGALSYTIHGVEEHGQQNNPAISVTKDGPYAVVGGVALLDQTWGQGASTEHYTLCRCGGSKNKPFCDGTHWNIGFKDEKN